MATKTEITPAGNSRFAKAGAWCFYDSEVLNLSFVHLMKFSTENRHIAKPKNVSNHYHSQNTPKIKFAFGAILVYIYTTTQSL